MGGSAGLRGMALPLGWKAWQHGKTVAGIGVKALALPLGRVSGSVAWALLDWETWQHGKTVVGIGVKDRSSNSGFKHPLRGIGVGYNLARDIYIGAVSCVIRRVGQSRTFIGIYGVYTEFLAGKSPYIRSYTVCVYGSGQP